MSTPYYIAKMDSIQHKIEKYQFKLENCTNPADRQVYEHKLQKYRGQMGGAVVIPSLRSEFEGNILEGLNDTIEAEKAEVIKLVSEINTAATEVNDVVAGLSADAARKQVEYLRKRDEEYKNAIEFVTKAHIQTIETANQTMEKMVQTKGELEGGIKKIHSETDSDQIKANLGAMKDQITAGNPIGVLNEATGKRNFLIFMIDFFQAIQGKGSKTVKQVLDEYKAVGGDISNIATELGTTLQELGRYQYAGEADAPPMLRAPYSARQLFNYNDAQTVNTDGLSSAEIAQVQVILAVLNSWEDGPTARQLEIGGDGNSITFHRSQGDADPRTQEDLEPNADTYAELQAGGAQEISLTDLLQLTEYDPEP